MRECDERWFAAHRLRAQFAAAARRQGLTLEEAEDVASEVVIRAAEYEALDTSQLPNWGKVVATRLAIDWQRKRPGPRLLARAARFELSECHPQDDVLERAEAVWLAVEAEALPTRQQAVLKARAEGKFVAEIAAELQCSYKSVESLTSRARSHLRAVLAGSLVALLGVLGKLRRLAPGEPAAALTALTVAGLALAGLSPQRSAQDPADLPHTVHDQRVVGSTPLTAQRSPVGFGRVRPGSVMSQATPAVPKVEVLVGPQAVGPVTVSPIKQKREDTNDGFVQSTEDCLRSGIDVSLTHVGCREPAAR
jgi:RNA polymerase sigma factor (sigma-70 family)